MYFAEKTLLKKTYSSKVKNTLLKSYFFITKYKVLFDNW